MTSGSFSVDPATIPALPLSNSIGFQPRRTKNTTLAEATPNKCFFGFHPSWPEMKKRMQQVHPLPPLTWAASVQSVV